MAFAQDIKFYCLFRVNGEKHVAEVMSINEAKARQHVLQMHPGLEILDLHPYGPKGIEEIYETVAELAKDPEWVPMNNMQLRDSATHAVLGDNAEQLLAEARQRVEEAQANQ